jgi:hypothetical protein
LNKFIEPLYYLLPQIQKIVQEQKPYQYFTKIDVSMQYYTFHVDDQSSEYCTIVTPLVSIAIPDYQWEFVNHPTLRKQRWKECLKTWTMSLYISMTLRSLMQHGKNILPVSRKCFAAFTVSPTKCDWAIKETDFLGFWFTTSGPKPWRKKIDAILMMSPPSNRTEVRAFCGAITFYHDMFHGRSDILAPITKLARKNVKFIWGPECNIPWLSIHGLLWDLPGTVEIVLSCLSSVQ